MRQLFNSLEKIYLNKVGYCINASVSIYSKRVIWILIGKGKEVNYGTGTYVVISRYNKEFYIYIQNADINVGNVFRCVKLVRVPCNSSMSIIKKAVDEMVSCL